MPDLIFLSTESNVIACKKKKPKKTKIKVFNEIEDSNKAFFLLEEKVMTPYCTR